MGNSQTKPKGWHSRRHESREAQDEAREAYRTRAERRPRQWWDDVKKTWAKDASGSDEDWQKFLSSSKSYRSRLRSEGRIS